MHVRVRLWLLQERSVSVCVVSLLQFMRVIDSDYVRSVREREHARIGHVILMCVVPCQHERSSPAHTRSRSICRALRRRPV